MLKHADERFPARAICRDALADYEQRRNESSLPMYLRNLERARFDLMPADLLALRAAVGGRKSDAREFWLADQKMIPPHTFFNPESLRRLLNSNVTHTSSEN